MRSPDPSDRRLAGRWQAATAVAALVVVLAGSAMVPATVAGASPADAGAPLEGSPAGGLDPGGSGDAGVEVEPRTGPDPSGQPVPDTGQRVVDSAIWLWLVVVLGGAFALIGWRWWHLSDDDVPLVPLDGPDGSVATGDEPSVDDGTSAPGVDDDGSQ